MHLSILLAYAGLQAVSAFPTNIHTLDALGLRLRSLENILQVRDEIYIHGQDLDFLLIRRADSPPRVELTSDKHPETIENKKDGKLPSVMHLLPDGEKHDRSDMKTHGKKGETVVDHALPAGTKEGKEATKKGKNAQKEVPKKEQDSEGGREAAAKKKARKQGTDKVQRYIDGKPAGKVTGADDGKGLKPLKPKKDDKNRVTKNKSESKTQKALREKKEKNQEKNKNKQTNKQQSTKNQPKRSSSTSSNSSSGSSKSSSSSGSSNKGSTSGSTKKKGKRSLESV